MGWKEIVGGLAVVISLIGYVPYLRDLFAGKTKPHSFSWLIWGILTAIGFMAQVSDGAGAGAWVQGFTLILCVIIFFVSLKYGSKVISKFDWFLLIMALLSFVPWMATSDATISILLLIVIDILGLIPTIRKTYIDPYSETLITWELNTFKHVLALFAMENYSITTSLYSIYLVTANAITIIMMIYRRKQIKKV